MLLVMLCTGKYIPRAGIPFQSILVQACGLPPANGGAVDSRPKPPPMHGSRSCT